MECWREQNWPGKGGEDVTREPIDRALLHGAVEIVPTEAGLRPMRLPGWVIRRAADPQLSMAASQPSGVRLEFDTRATVVELTARAERFGYVGVPPRAVGIFDVLVDGDLHARASLETATQHLTDMSSGLRSTTVAEPETLRIGLPAGDKRVEIWLPHTESVELVSVTAAAELRPVPSGRPRWVHHGSSISQGSNAIGPSSTWVARAARSWGLDLTNLGFGGSALADSFTAKAMAALPADLITVALGINIVNADLMRRRALRSAVHGFLDVLRDAQPETPIGLLTPTWCAIHENTPGPGAFDPEALARGEVRFIATGDPASVTGGALTLEVVRSELAEIVEERADDRLGLVDGLALYGEADAEAHPLPDGLHPDEETHALIAERFVRSAGLSALLPWSAG